nr:casparian strip membrane protein 2-like [Ipomoea batatas]
MKADGATEGGGGEASRGARGISIMDLILRVVAIVGSLGSAVAMGTTDQTLPFIIQSFRFEAQYDDFDTFKLFVIVSAIVCGYLALTLPLSIFHILRTRAEKSRILLIFLDTMMMGLLTAGASSAAGIVYLAHNGNSSANWPAICQPFQDFCRRTSASLIGSFVAIVMLLLLVLLSAIALHRTH